MQGQNSMSSVDDPRRRGATSVVLWPSAGPAIEALDGLQVCANRATFGQRDDIGCVSESVGTTGCELAGGNRVAYLMLYGSGWTQRWQLPSGEHDRVLLEIACVQLHSMRDLLCT